ncbi:MAG: class I SAM-dependent methyltransferase, partial [Clostridia bacterium]|nr:class I SAM-dependent methyltransferase [Clostridia bacterium]
GYKMIAGDARDCSWLDSVSGNNAIVVMEGVAMYLSTEQMQQLTKSLSARFSKVALLVDTYTTFGAKMSKYKNPVKDVGVTQVYGVDDPTLYNGGQVVFVSEHTMIPQQYINQLKGVEKFIFAKLYAGGISKKLYRLFEFLQ